MKNLTLLLFAVVACWAWADRVDPRVRTYVDPVRIVWKTAAASGHSGRFAVADEQTLLAPKHGQVPELGWKVRTGCRLVNNGNAPGIVLDFGRELHGGLQLALSAASTRNLRVRLRFGESVAETFSDALSGERGASNDHAQRDLELTLPVMGTQEIGNTGFRFVRIDLLLAGTAVFDSIRAISLMRPMTAVGNFRSSDERLNRVFDTAVRTVHLCCQDYLWDGIKRDRLVWMGDTHPETMVILNVFGAAAILPESLDYMAATTPPDQWMNTMPTYTFWWIRNVAEWYRYTGDRSYLAKHADYLDKTFAHVEKGLDKDGVWTAGNFLDWPTKHNDKAATAGTQGLALETAREVVLMAEALNRPALAARARAFAAKIAAQKPDPNGAKSAAALLALAGLCDPKEMYDAVLGQKGHADVSTFYGYYMLEAMSRAGAHQRALDTVRDYWGAMLDVGATSFWEDFNLAWTNNCFRIDEVPVPGKKDIHGDYGEFCYPGFRHSFCHGWSGGPAAWCINHVLGIRPLDVGCRTVEVKPFLGDLAWAEGAMALPDGRAVMVRASRNPDGTMAVTVDAPPGIKVVR
ncbi:MAG: alpha-L-rhamnosidase [Kiritimatiellae bacterium]|nr:alpha-L-rhamnosidase [Kiritimatiellia bacterium]